MTGIEFITASRVDGLSDNNLFDFILDRVSEDNIVVLEKSLDPEQKLNLIAKGLNYIQNEDYAGIKMFHFSIKTGTERRWKSENTIQFNLIAPGNSEINQKREGHYQIKTNDSEINYSVI
ncbi:MAG: DUF2073 domain-containing protein [Candidatus Heimdallarchaeota archaeon]|nr:DUF2073 domain-containing protein [Candidatus Heimdallarchaeota archaeon]MDH5646952.1 DUF2073 domain-containing protein [Candidatus Heimdallarchaeota archaeon]